MTSPAGFTMERAPITPPAEEAVEEMQSLGSEQIKLVQDRAKNDTYFLAKGVLGYQDVNIRTHGPMCRYLDTDTKIRRMLLYPRGTLKTTVGTITQNIKDAITDPDGTRNCIFNEIEDNSIKILNEIKAHWETNDMLRFLFADLVPEKFTGPGSRWSQKAASINRSSVHKEPTWSAFGISGSPTSQHFTHIFNDDIIGEAAKESPAVMKDAVRFVSSLDPLLVEPAKNRIEFVGTRKTMHDAYEHALKIYRGMISLHKRLPVEGGDSIFPERLPLWFLMNIKATRPEFYAAEYANDPISGGARDFDVAKLRNFVFANNGDVVYRDDAGEIQRWERAHLDIVITVDPNSGELTAPDFCAIIVSGVSPTNQIFVLETWSDRVTPTDQVDKIFELWKKWRPRVVGIEQAGQQSTRFYFEQKAREEGVSIRVQPLKPKNRDKPTRIRGALQPIINARRLYILKTQTVLEHHVEHHPDLENDDEIDALAYATEPGMWSTPFNPLDQEEIDDAIELALAGRNPRTGY